MGSTWGLARTWRRAWPFSEKDSVPPPSNVSLSQNVRQWSFLTRLAPSATESVNSRGRRRSMWACAFRATFISSISFIYLLILLYSHSFSKHCHSLHRETFSRHPSVREDELGGLHTHTHTSSSVRKSNHASGNTSWPISLHSSWAGEGGMFICSASPCEYQ